MVVDKTSVSFELFPVSIGKTSGGNGNIGQACANHNNVILLFEKELKDFLEYTFVCRHKIGTCISLSAIITKN